MSFKRDLQTSLKGTYRSVMIFLIINVSVFLIGNILIHLVIMGGDKRIAEDTIYNYLGINSDFKIYLTRFWTVITYCFVHVKFGHILFNMLMLYFMGRVFCELLGSKRLVTVYFLGGLSAGILYLIWAGIFPPPPSSLVGASGSVMALVVAVAASSPDYRVYPYGIAMKLKWLALILVVLSTLIDISVNTGGKVAHLGGALFGLCYGYILRTGNPFTNMMEKRTKLRVAHKRGTDHDYITLKTNVRKRVDEILDKISRSGYDSLSREEKEFLQKNHDKL